MSEEDKLLIMVKIELALAEIKKHSGRAERRIKQHLQEIKEILKCNN